MNEHIKFADDGTIWATADTIVTAFKVTCGDVRNIKGWCVHWKMWLSLPKTELNVYSAKKQDTDRQLFQVDGKDLPYNKTPKLLDITLDERLDSKSHIANTEVN